MGIRFGSHSVTLFALLSALCSRGSAFPMGGYSSLRLRDAVEFDGQSKEDRSQLPLKTDVDIYQSPLFDSEKLYRRSEALPSRMRRYTDSIFTSEYSKLLGQMAARRYLESLIRKGESAQGGQGPSKRYTDAVFPDDYSRMQRQMALKNYIDNKRSRMTRHTDGVFTSEYSKLLGQMAARRYLESLKRKGASAQGGQGPSKCYTDAVFPDDYSRMQRQMALKNYIDNNRMTRHTDGVFTSEYSKLLGQMAARRYLESLKRKGASAQGGQGPSKRYTDAVFPDDYSRMQRQMALKNYIDNKRSHEESTADNLSDTAPLDEN